MNVITTEDITKRVRVETKEIKFYVKKLEEIRAQKQRLEKIERNYERLLVEQVNAQ